MSFHVSFYKISSKQCVLSQLKIIFLDKFDKSLNKMSMNVSNSFCHMIINIKQTFIKPNDDDMLLYIV